MVARLAGRPRRQVRRRSAELLERFGLADVAGKRVASYSGGFRRRLDLAASLVSEPSVFFMDEPTTGLDLPSRLTLWEVIGELRSTGVTVFLTTQYLEEADQLADTIAVINTGRVVAEGSPRELKQRVGSGRLELKLISGPAFAEVARAAGTRIGAADAGRLSVSVATEGSATQVRDLLDALDPAREALATFAVRSATLDDVVLTLTQPAHQEAISG